LTHITNWQTHRALDPGWRTARLGSESASESESKGSCTGLGHERLDGYTIHEDAGELVVSRKDTDADAEGSMNPANRQPAA
jgi:hypothetical protein